MMKILIYDDHKIFSQSFKLLLKDLGYKDVEVCDTPKCVQEKLSTGEKQLIFTDYLIPDVDVSQLIKTWKLYNNVSVVVLSSITSAYQIAGLLKNKADAFLSKSVEAEEIEECMSEVINGKTYISKDLRNDVMNVFINRAENLFTTRELEVIDLIKQGNSIKEKAKKLFLSENTIIVHRRNIMQKANVKSVTELLSKIDDLI